MHILFSLVKEILRIFSFINMYLFEEVFDRKASFFSADKVLWLEPELSKFRLQIRGVFLME